MSINVKMEWEVLDYLCLEENNLFLSVPRNNDKSTTLN